MKILSIREMLKKVQREGYAVPAFNIHNLETLQVVVDTAAGLRSPVILAGTPSTILYAGGKYIVSMAEVAAKKYNIPIAIHLDHFEDVEEIKHYVGLGFKSTVIDASHEDYEPNINTVKEVIEYAYKFDATVEAELGRLGGQKDNLVVDEKDSMYTNPKQAKEFAERTGIGSLAIAIGTAHGLYKGEAKLDFDRLKGVRDIIDIPLVLHGASDVPNELVKKAISLGICKVDVTTDLKIPFSNTVERFFNEHPDASDPRKYTTPGKEVMKNTVAHRIMVCGSSGKA